jgi:hypothetical protein
MSCCGLSSPSSFCPDNVYLVSEEDQHAMAHAEAADPAE